MKAQNGLKFPSELCFGTINAKKDSHLLSSKVAFLKSGQNAAGICPFFYGGVADSRYSQQQWAVEQNIIRTKYNVAYAQLTVTCQALVFVVLTQEKERKFERSDARDLAVRLQCVLKISSKKQQCA